LKIPAFLPVESPGREPRARLTKAQSREGDGAIPRNGKPCLTFGISLSGFTHSAFLHSVGESRGLVHPFGYFGNTLRTHLGDHTNPNRKF
jgi:hypothetical protein